MLKYINFFDLMLYCFTIARKIQ